jgi:hypothetical protein
MKESTCLPRRHIHRSALRKFPIMSSFRRCERWALNYQIPQKERVEGGSLRKERKERTGLLVELEDEA